jgi:bacteriocin resistance YdeI/OmpD-like protein/uncharacterized protein DUF1905
MISKSTSKPLKFIATIYRIWMMRHVDVPQEISDALAKAYAAGTPKLRKGQKPKYIPVVAVVNGRSARATLVPAGPGRYRLQIITALRKAAQADTGDAVAVELCLDQESRSLPVPSDLQTALKEHPKARKAFENFAPGHRRQFIQWYDAAKSPDVRRRRLDRALDILLERAALSRRTRP